MRRALFVVMVSTVAACRGKPSLRERVLANIPASATVVAVADGSALAEPVPSAAWRYAANWIPMDLYCALDLARHADEVALSFEPEGETLIIATHAPFADCGVLYKIDGEDGLWRATAGAPPVAGRSVLDDDRDARARPYLLDARAAFAARFSEPRTEVIAATGSGSGEGWIAIDAGDPDALARRARRWHDQGALAHLVIARSGRQTTVHFAALDEDLGFRVVDGLAIGLGPERSPTPVADLIPCPPHGVVDRCARDRWSVESVPLAIAAIANSASDAVFEPVAGVGPGSSDHDEILGYRLTIDAPSVGLERGDEVVSIDGKPIRSHEELAWHDLDHATVGLRRHGRLTIIELISE